MQEKREEKLGEALMKVALGFQVAEVTEEYAEVDGALKLMKRKKTKKDVPPDLKAVQLLLAENGGAGLETRTDAQLQEEKQRLLALLETADKEKKGAGQVCDEKKNTVKKPRPKPRKKVVRTKKGE